MICLLAPSAKELELGESLDLGERGFSQSDNQLVSLAQSHNEAWLVGDECWMLSL